MAFDVCRDRDRQQRCRRSFSFTCYCIVLSHSLSLSLSLCQFLCINMHISNSQSASHQWTSNEKTTSNDGKWCGCCTCVLTHAEQTNKNLCFLFICVHTLLVNHIHTHTQTHRQKVCRCLKQNVIVLGRSLWQSLNVEEWALSSERLDECFALFLSLYSLFFSCRSLSSFWFLCVHLTQFIANCEPFCLDPNCQLMFAQFKLTHLLKTLL